MLISEFARATGLTADTIRFYVRRGLLDPEQGGKGGSIPYHVFTEQHVELARVIKLAQSLGFSLKEIAAFNDEYRAGALTPSRGAEIMRRQLDRLEDKAAQLDAMIRYMRAKLHWLDDGAKGPEPQFGEAAGCACALTAPMREAPRRAVRDRAAVAR